MILTYVKCGNCSITENINSEPRAPILGFCTTKVVDAFKNILANSVTDLQISYYSIEKKSDSLIKTYLTFGVNCLCGVV